MTSLLVLIACIVVPLATCSALKLVFVREIPEEPAAKDRMLGRFRRATLAAGTLIVIGAAVCHGFSKPDFGGCSRAPGCSSDSFPIALFPLHLY